MIKFLAARSRVNKQRSRCWRSMLIIDIDLHGLLLLNVLMRLIVSRLVDGRAGRSCWYCISLFYFVNTLDVIVAPFMG